MSTCRKKINYHIKKWGILKIHAVQSTTFCEGTSARDYKFLGCWKKLVGLLNNTIIFLKQIHSNQKWSGSWNRMMEFLSEYLVMIQKKNIKIKNIDISKFNFPLGFEPILWFFWHFSCWPTSGQILQLLIWQISYLKKQSL